jgi:hypothetical protein
MRSLKISGKASRSRSNLAKYNPHHDSRGRFASGAGGGGSATGAEVLPQGKGYGKSDPHPSYDGELGPYIEHYTGTASDPLNEYFRKGVFPKENGAYLSKEDVPDYKHALDATLAQTYTTKDMTLYRGIGTDGVAKFQNLQVGQTFTDKGYVSTTPDTSQLWDFMPANGDTSGVVLEISVPKGSKVLSMQKYFNGVSPSYAPGQQILDEAEHLLPRNTLFKVMGVGTTKVSLNSQRPGNKPDLLIKVEAATVGLNNVG